MFSTVVANSHEKTHSIDCDPSQNLKVNEHAILPGSWESYSYLKFFLSSYLLCPSCLHGGISGTESESGFDAREIDQYGIQALDKDAVTDRSEASLQSKATEEGRIAKINFGYTVIRHTLKRRKECASENMQTQNGLDMGLASAATRQEGNNVLLQYESEEDDGKFFLQKLRKMNWPVTPSTRINQQCKRKLI